MPKEAVHSAAAPRAIGAYSQAVRAGDCLYMSGQIPLSPETMEIVPGDVRAQITQVFENLKAVAAAAGASLDDAVKLTVYLTDLADFPAVNELMGRYFSEPYPARATIQVSALPRGSLVEVDAILALGR